MLTAAQVDGLVERELNIFQDPALKEKIIRGRVAPYCQLRAWAYSTTAGQFPCWIVYEEPSKRVGIAYCELRFGPTTPWGLLWLKGGHQDMGDDSGWFARLEDAVADVE